MMEEIVQDAEDRMSKALDFMRDEFRGMRTGRAHPGLVESIRVDYYGSPTPVKGYGEHFSPRTGPNCH